MIYICIFDFEITSYETNDYHEVIEITSILYEWDGNYNFISDFQEFCKPKNRPKLCNYCKYITGILQEDVNNALPFNQVLKKHYKWLLDNCDISNVYFVTYGTFPLSNMALFEYNNYKMTQQQKSQVSENSTQNIQDLQCDDGFYTIKVPEIYFKFIDIKYEFSQFYNTKIYRMKSMLKKLNIKYYKRNENYNSININNLLKKMIVDGLEFDDMDIIKIIL